MFDTDDRSWLPNSILATTARAEIAFLLCNEFNKDPWAVAETDGIPLAAPSISAIDPYRITSAQVLGHERALAEHYKAVLQLARQHNQSYNEIETHFWLRLHFEWEQRGLGFSWYDNFQPMEGLFDWLASAAEGDDWSDIEQGWEMICVRLVGSRFHFRQGRFDQGGETANVALPRDTLLGSISDLRGRMRLIIPRLVAEIGEDYWTRYRYDLRADLESQP
jgi:hypothetical protein